jgi:glutathione S-transferase
VLRLVTIPISHYCEKARWALDRAAIAYREQRHVQIVHIAAARLAGGGRTVPVLVTPQGAVADSAAILEWVDERVPAELRLFGGDDGARAEQRHVCARLDARLGPHGRRLMYVHMLGQREVAAPVNNQGLPGWEDRLMRAGWPVAARVIARALGVRPGVEVEDEAVVWEEFDHVASLLADGRPFLAGERFGAADLTFAALSASVTMPPAYGVPLPQPSQLAPHTAALVERFREHPAGRFALELFARHRRALTASATG